MRPFVENTFITQDFNVAALGVHGVGKDWLILHWKLATFQTKGPTNAPRMDHAIAGIGELGPSHGVSTSGQEKQTFVLRNGYGMILKRIVIEDYFSPP